MGGAGRCGRYSARVDLRWALRSQWCCADGPLSVEADFSRWRFYAKKLANKFSSDRDIHDQLTTCRLGPSSRHSYY